MRFPDNYSKNTHYISMCKSLQGRIISVLRHFKSVDLGKSPIPAAP